MTTSTTRIIALGLCSTLGLNSCAIDQLAYVPAIVPGLHVHSHLHGRDARTAALVAAGALLVTAVIVASYRANQEQRYQAEQRARAQLARPRVRNEVRKKKVRYVAVPVKRDESKSKGRSGPSQHLMKVNAETGKPTGEVFVPKAGQEVRNGNVVKLGGDEALYYGSSVHGV